MAKYDESVYDERRIAEIQGMMGNDFPNMLTLKDQGRFMLGYYQQKDDDYRRIKAAKETKEAKSSK